jgi:hypothetical protein
MDKYKEITNYWNYDANCTLYMQVSENKKFSEIYKKLEKTKLVLNWNRPEGLIRKSLGRKEMKRSGERRMIHNVELHTVRLIRYLL